MLSGHYRDVAHARTWLVSFIEKQWNCNFVASCRRDKVTDKRYLYIHIRDSRSALNYRKKGQLAQLVRESDLFFRLKRQIKTVLTNVVVEHMKTRMSKIMQKQGNGKSVVHNKPEYADVQMLWWKFYWFHLYTSPYHIYKTVLIAKNK